MRSDERTSCVLSLHSTVSNEVEGEGERRGSRFRPAFSFLFERVCQLADVAICYELHTDNYAVRVVCRWFSRCTPVDDSSDYTDYRKNPTNQFVPIHFCFFPFLFATSRFGGLVAKSLIRRSAWLMAVR